ncbi:MAG: hypothetical protein ACI90V_009576 [Bacillariaceae sp.]|jgi:hypothetical protein
MYYVCVYVYIVYIYIYDIIDDQIELLYLKGGDILHSKYLKSQEIA